MNEKIRGSIIDVLKDEFHDRNKQIQHDNAIWIKQCKLLN